MSKGGRKDIDWTELKKPWASSLNGRALLRNGLILIEERCAVETLIWLDDGHAPDLDLFLKPLEGAIEIATQPLGYGDAASRGWLSLTKAALAPSPGEGGRCSGACRGTWPGRWKTTCPGPTVLARNSSTGCNPRHVR